MQFVHRFYSTLEEEKKKGKRHFILYGNNIYYDLFYNKRYGVYDSVDSLAVQIYMNQKAVQNVICIDSSGMYLFEFEQKKFKKRKIPNSEILTTFGLAKTQNKSFTNDLNNRQEQQTNVNQNADAAQNLQDTQAHELQMAFSLVEKVLSEISTPTAVIVKDLEWIAELFKGKDHHLKILQSIENWWQKNDLLHFTYIIVKSYEEMKQYFNLEENSDKLIYVGGPTVIEMLRTVQSIEHFGVDTVFLEKVFKQVKNNGLSLRDFLNLYKDIRHELGKNITVEEELIKAIESRIDANIDEEVLWEDVILDENIKTMIDLSLQEFQSNQGKVKSGSKGILLYGPPGTGKTFIAKAIANRGGFYFSSPKLADLKGQYVGQSAPKVKKLFDDARSNSPSLIFLDELDALFPKRGMMANADSYAADITNQFLAEIDGVDTAKQDVFIIGATNRIDIIDSAIMSRLKRVEIGLPSELNRESLFKIHLKTHLSQFTTSQQDELMKRSDGLSGRDIKTLSSSILQQLNEDSNSQTAMEFAFNETRKNLARTFQNAENFDITLFDENSSEGLNSIVGYEREKNVLRRVVNTIMHSQRFAQFGVSNYNGVMLYGPPGNGKTIFAQAVAKEFNLDFVKIVGSTLAMGSLDLNIQTFEKIVQKVMQMSPLNPLLIFFDEFDGIANSHINSQFRSVLLDRINTLRQKGRIVIMAATNFYEHIDEAIIRPGRFDEHLKFDNPSSDTVPQLLEYFLKNKNFDSSGLDFTLITQRLLEANQSMSISAIKTLCDDVIRDAIIDNPDLDSNIPIKEEYFNV